MVVHPLASVPSPRLSVLLWCLMACSVTDRWHEGCTFAAGGAGTGLLSDFFRDTWPVNFCGSQPTFDCGRQRSKVGKRSFRRACARAEDAGFTWYRGQLYTAAQLGVSTPGPKSFPDSPPSHTQAPRQQHRIARGRRQIFNWNALPELSAWAHDNGFQICLVQEARWKFESEWMDSQCMYVHAGCSAQKGAGVLTMISKSLCPQSQLSYRVLKEGRLLHVRLHVLPRPIDVVNIYQHVQKSANFLLRQTLFETLDAALAAFPLRNTLVVAGDFNTSLPCIPKYVGLRDYCAQEGGRVAGPQHRDSGILPRNLVKRDLVALNTWDTSLGPTYHALSGASSRIDFILTRSSQVDVFSKRISYLTSFSGTLEQYHWHDPLVCSLPRCWIPYNRSQPLPKVTLKGARD